MTEKSITSELPTGNACTMLMDSCLGWGREQESFTAAFHPETRETISNPKLSSCESDSQTMNSSKTLDQVSISKGRALIPYWNESCLELSKKLLSLTKTGLCGSDLICSNPSQPNSLAGSWFSKTHNSLPPLNSCRISLPLSTSLAVGFTDSESTVVRSAKIRIYPKKTSNQLFNRYAGLARYWYNQAVSHLKGEGTRASMAEVRKIQKNEHPSWAFNCPQRIREHAMADACEAVKNAKRKSKSTAVFQKVKFRAKRDSIQGFGFDAQSLKDGFVFSGKSYRVNFHPSEEFNISKEGTRVVRKSGRWFLIVPNERPVQVPETQRNGIVALDPGVRTFLTYYSETMHGKIGEGDFKNIYRLCYALDALQSKISKAKCKQKRRMRKASERLRYRIFDLVDDLHKKTAYWLVTTFAVILLPTFETSKMVTKLWSKVARSMLNFAHYGFKTFLKSKAEEYSCRVIDADESYTSKTCSYCGKIQNIGSKKVMRCPCGAIVCRDGNASRGIFLRALTATSSEGEKLRSHLQCIC